VKAMVTFGAIAGAKTAGAESAIVERMVAGVGFSTALMLITSEGPTLIAVTEVGFANGSTLVEWFCVSLNFSHPSK
jgi:hypothetical protein